MRDPVIGWPQQSQQGPPLVRGAGEGLLEGFSRRHERLDSEIRGLRWGRTRFSSFLKCVPGKEERVPSKVTCEGQRV